MRGCLQHPDNRLIKLVETWVQIQDFNSERLLNLVKIIGDVIIYLRLVLFFKIERSLLNRKKSVCILKEEKSGFLKTEGLADWFRKAIDFRRLFELRKGFNIESNS